MASSISQMQNTEDLLHAKTNERGKENDKLGDTGNGENA